jgi:pyruvate/2-oxoglutarate dehydrogenase complex dihydrolipoamide acyltransferase (E2) component
MITLITVPRYIALIKNYGSKPRITKWLKEDGQPVEKDETLVIVETTKTSLEIEAPAAGLVFSLKKVRDAVRIGDLIGVVASDAAAFEAYKDDPEKMVSATADNI